MGKPLAEELRPLVRALAGTDEPPIAIRFWDGSSLGPTSGDLPDGPSATLVVRSPDAIRRIVWAPNELGLGRAYVAGDIEVEGDVFAALQLRDGVADDTDRAVVRMDGKSWIDALRTARRVGALGRPLPPPAEEARLRGRRHSRERDAAAIAHHYDVGNKFYRLVLGPAMTYSCAYFETPSTSLEDAQEAKYGLIARKLGLTRDMRMLDVGCGWGGMVMHAAREFGARAVGITISSEQAELAEKRVAEAGLSDRVEIRLQDYRDIDDGPYDAVSSIGMFEHVGLDRLTEYFAQLTSLVRPGGRVLNHAISRPSGEGGFDKHSFIDRFVFPDGELHEVGTVVSSMQGHGLEVRDVHSLREHYAITLRHWVRNLESDWERAVSLVGEPRARVWRLYLAASAVNFEDGRTNIHQVLAVKPRRDGRSHLPLTRMGFLG